MKMAEPSLAQTTDIPPASPVKRSSTSPELSQIDSCLSPSGACDLDATEDHPLKRPPADEASANMATSTSVKIVESDLEIARRLTERFALNEDTDSDNDSFDDEEETALAESILSAVTNDSAYLTLTCPICLETAFLRPSSCCTFQCCSACWRAHISAAINDGRIKVPCISSDCNKYLTKESIVDFIRHDTVLHERFLKLYIIANQDPRAKTCPRCCHVYSLDENDPHATSKDTAKSSHKISSKKIPKQVQCAECSLVWCFRCSAPWHEGLTCKQFAKGDKLLMKWIKQKNEDQWNARKCPKCSSFIQRAGGCPHMTCSSCQCEFCYLCGRRYFKIPVIGHHNNKYSMFGCPYNLHPKKPWLRRTIRGSIATGVIVASPVIVVGAVTAAVTVLPTLGVYKLVRHIRSRRRAHAAAVMRDYEVPDILLDMHADFYGQLSAEDFPEGIVDGEESPYQPILSLLGIATEENSNDAFPLSIYADMDVENLFTDVIVPTVDTSESNEKPAGVEEIASEAPVAS